MPRTLQAAVLMYQEYIFNSSHRNLGDVQIHMYVYFIVMKIVTQIHDVL